MLRKIFAAVIALVMVFCVCGCAQNEVFVSTDEPVSSEEKSTTAINPLTGLEIDSSKKNAKPVAIMINNIKTAQPVQTGLMNADVVYETLVEGGITRMVAVTKDVTKLGQIGSVRSARYVFLDLALGHDAVYAHAGFDQLYFANHRSELGLKTFDLNSGATSKYGFRYSNGLSSEHTMYTTGEKLAKGIDDLDFGKTSSVDKWLTFGDKDAPTTPANVCNSINVYFSGSYKSVFTYDAESGKYIKSVSGTTRTDYLTKEKFAFKNVFVLFTSVSPFSDGYHMNVELTGGTGYYVSNGGYEEISWSKGSAKSPLKITKADGTELTVNAGTSYICITDKDDKAHTTITAE